MKRTPYIAAGLLLLAGAGCSTSSSSGSNGSCAELAACCVGLSGTQQTTCASILSTAEAAGTCAGDLVSAQESGLCGKSSGLEAGLPDVTVSTCAQTGTCPDAHGSNCVPGTCDGVSYETCESTASGTCVATLTSGSKSYECDGCDCSLALSTVCGGTTPPVDGGGGGDETGTTAGNDSGGGAMDAGKDACLSTPTLHSETEAGVFCPYTAGGDTHCTAGQTCCEVPGQTGASTCDNDAGACVSSGSIEWQCNGPDDCATSPSGSVCCGDGTVMEDTGCGWEEGTGFTETHCATSCGSDEVIICDKTTYPCPSGTCTPFRVIGAGVELGTCL